MVGNLLYLQFIQCGQFCCCNCKLIFSACLFYTSLFFLHFDLKVSAGAYFINLYTFPFACSLVLCSLQQFMNLIYKIHELVPYFLLLEMRITSMFSCVVCSFKIFDFAANESSTSNQFVSGIAISAFKSSIPAIFLQSWHSKFRNFKFN